MEVVQGPVSVTTSIFLRKKGTFETFRVHPGAPILERVGKNEDDIEIISEDDFKRYHEILKQEKERRRGLRVGPVPKLNGVAAVGNLEDMTKKQLFGLIELEQLVVAKTPNMAKGELIAAIQQARLGKAPQAASEGSVPPPDPEPPAEGEKEE